MRENQKAGFGAAVLTYNLNIESAEQSDSGQWKCEVSNPHGSSNATCNLRVFDSIPPLDEPPSFTKLINNVTVEEDTDGAIFECKFKGLPLPDVIWYRDDAEIRSGGQLEIETTKDGTSTLHVNAILKPDNTSVFRCKVSNIVGTSTTEGKLTVTEKIIMPDDEVIIEQVPKKRHIKKRVKVEKKKKVRESSVARGNQELESFIHSIYKDEETERALLKLSVRWEEDQGLYFPIHLRNKCVVNDSYIVMGCFATGVLPMDTRWYRDGQELYHSDKYLIRSRGGMHSLEITHVLLEDTGHYVCEVSNAQGTISSTCYLQVEPTLDPYIECTRPQFMKRLKNQVATEGEQANLLCAAKGSPVPGFKWTKDGLELHENDRMKIQYDDVGVALLQISDVRFSDKGLYTCMASNMAGRCKCAASLSIRERKEMLTPVSSESEYEDVIEEITEVVDVKRVIHKEPPKYEPPPEYTPHNTTTVIPRQPTFMKQLPSIVELPVNGRVFLECRAIGFPKPEVCWLKDEKPLQKNDHYLLLSLGEWHALEILEAQYPSDNGRYVVRASNEASSSESQCLLTILLFSVAGEIHTSLENFTTIPPSNDFEELPLVTDSYEDDFDIPLILPTGLMCHSEALTNHDTEDIPDSQTSPHFETSLEETYFLLEMDENINISCKVAGDPLPDVIWFKDGRHLRPDSNITLQWNPATRIANVYMKRFKILDTGKYKCIAYSPIGWSETNTEVHQKRLELFNLGSSCLEGSSNAGGCSFRKRPEFSVPLRNKTAYEDDMIVKFNCVIMGTPPPTVKWYMDNIEIGSFPGKRIVTSHAGSHCLEIFDVEKEDGCSYTCEATNDIGTVSSSATLLIEDPSLADVTGIEYGRPFFVEELQSVSVSEGEDAVCRCIANGNPWPRFKWQKDSIDVLQSDKISVTIDKTTGETTLTIRNVTTRDTGLYFCIAHSKAGRVKSCATVTVKEERRKTWHGDPAETEEILRHFRARLSSMDMIPLYEEDSTVIDQEDITHEMKSLTAEDLIRTDSTADGGDEDIVMNGPDDSKEGDDVFQDAQAVSTDRDESGTLNTETADIKVTNTDVITDSSPQEEASEVTDDTDGKVSTTETEVASEPKLDSETRQALETSAKGLEADNPERSDDKNVTHKVTDEKVSTLDASSTTSEERNDSKPTSVPQDDTIVEQNKQQQQTPVQEKDTPPNKPSATNMEKDSSKAENETNEQPGVPPQILQKPKSQFLLAGNVSKFVIKVEADPDPNVIWFKDGKKISLEGHYSLVKEK